MEGCSTAENQQSLIDRASCIVIHSGNILYQLLETPDEICKSFCGVVKKWIENEPTQEIYSGSGFELIIRSIPNVDSLLENRSNLKITIKLFIQNLNCKSVDVAFLNLIEDLKCERIDSVLLSLPPNEKSSDQEFQKHEFNDFKEVWLELESLVKLGFIKNLGVCNFDGESLKDLHRSSVFKPVSNQVSQSRSCTLPPDLIEVSSSCNVELLTHNDPIDILPSDTLQQILPPTNSNKLWKAEFLLRYTCVESLRQVIKTKGYVLRMKSNEKCVK